VYESKEILCLNPTDRRGKLVSQELDEEYRRVVDACQSQPSPLRPICAELCRVEGMMFDRR
jgi:hypothetical protein